MASENVELVRSIFAVWERGDWSSAAWADLYDVFTLRDGLIVRIEEYTTRADALKAAGLSE